jgi:hypothetical protein
MVQGKGYDSEIGTGRARSGTRSSNASSSFNQRAFSRAQRHSPQLNQAASANRKIVLPRLGQGLFRVLLTDAKEASRWTPVYSQQRLFLPFSAKITTK